ncbi:hypothetical protein GGR52DRAFT_590336 [Hypoxylon sp. FL1284]|nr:hypothetical protein GGR52DRAFT_590336 [Hypoxylon sp. FL1284]
MLAFTILVPALLAMDAAFSAFWGAVICLLMNLILLPAQEHDRFNELSAIALNSAAIKVALTFPLCGLTQAAHGLALIRAYQRQLPKYPAGSVAMTSIMVCSSILTNWNLVVAYLLVIAISYVPSAFWSALWSALSRNFALLVPEAWVTPIPVDAGTQNDPPKPQELAVVKKAPETTTEVEPSPPPATVDPTPTDNVDPSPPADGACPSADPAADPASVIHPPSHRPYPWEKGYTNPMFRADRRNIEKTLAYREGLKPYNYARSGGTPAEPEPDHESRPKVPVAKPETTELVSVSSDPVPVPAPKAQPELSLSVPSVIEVVPEPQPEPEKVREPLFLSGLYVVEMEPDVPTPVDEENAELVHNVLAELLKEPEIQASSSPVDPQEAPTQPQPTYIEPETQAPSEPAQPALAKEETMAFQPVPADDPRFLYRDVEQISEEVEPDRLEDVDAKFTRLIEVAEYDSDLREFAPEMAWLTEQVGSLTLDEADAVPYGTPDAIAITGPSNAEIATIGTDGIQQDVACAMVSHGESFPHTLGAVERPGWVDVGNTTTADNINVGNNPAPRRDYFGHPAHLLDSVRANEVFLYHNPWAEEHKVVEETSPEEHQVEDRPAQDQPVALQGTDFTGFQLNVEYDPSTLTKNPFADSDNAVNTVEGGHDITKESLDKPHEEMARENLERALEERPVIEDQSLTEEASSNPAPNLPSQTVLTAQPEAVPAPSSPAPVCIPALAQGTSATDFALTDFLFNPAVNTDVVSNNPFAVRSSPVMDEDGYTSDYSITDLEKALEEEMGEELAQQSQPSAGDPVKVAEEVADVEMGVGPVAAPVFPEPRPAPPALPVPSLPMLDASVQAPARVASPATAPVPVAPARPAPSTPAHPSTPEPPSTLGSGSQSSRRARDRLLLEASRAHVSPESVVGTFEMRAPALSALPASMIVQSKPKKQDCNIACLSATPSPASTPAPSRAPSRAASAAPSDNGKGGQREEKKVEKKQVKKEESGEKMGGVVKGLKKLPPRPQKEVSVFIQPKRRR